MHARFLAVLAISIWAQTSCAHADEPIKGTFTARQTCPALLSIRKQTNPGAIRLAPGQVYKVLSKNKPDATYYRVYVDGADPSERWVPVECGSVSADGTAQAPGNAPVPLPAPSQADNAPVAKPAYGGGLSYVFAVSWQAAFCQGLPDKTECRTQTADRYDATHFTLHGLWPQPRGTSYCGLSDQIAGADQAHQWDRLPEPDLQPATRAALQKVMPGVASNLQRHEWAEHGSCFFEKSADAYFSREIELIGQLNASPVQKLFADNIGREISVDAIRQAFDAGFGDGAGDRVRVTCKRYGGRPVIVELALALRGDVNDKPSLATLLAGGAPTNSSCKSGVVDPVGGQ